MNMSSTALPIDRKTRLALFLLPVILGVTYGLLTVFALISGLEHKIALSGLVLIGLIIGVSKLSRRLLVSFAIGFFTALFALATQMLLAGTYFHNNPQYLDVEIPFGLSPVQFTVLFAPIGSFVAGSISMIFAALFGLGIALIRPRS